MGMAVLTRASLQIFVIVYHKISQISTGSVKILMYTVQISYLFVGVATWTRW